MSDQAPTFSVIISTFGRADMVSRTVETVLANSFPSFELIVVDQNQDALTETVLTPFCTDKRLHYLKTSTIGLACGRNEGIRRARGEVIAMTDDDCAVPSNWLTELERAFASNPRIEIVMGNIVAGPHDHAAGFISAYVRTRPFLARGIQDKHRVEGIAACMGIRRALWQRMGGFDEMLGAGAFFKAAEDSDLVVRALLEGVYVYETPAVWLTHHGFRTWEQGSSLIQGYMFGLAAMYAKQLKCGRWGVVSPLAHMLARWAFGRPIVDLGRRPSRALRLKAFAHGLVTGATTPLDASKQNYAKRK
jgi:GT2 family glycosyltransferase